jgi:hypothetical protein
MSNADEQQKQCRIMRVKEPMNDAEQQARSQVESIFEMIDALRKAQSDSERESAQTVIYEDPLSVEVRSDWHTVGAGPVGASEFKIDLCTGGPAVRIVGDLNRHDEPESATVQYQDWFTPWHTLHGLTNEQHDAVLEYCRQFYFAECVTN